MSRERALPRSRQAVVWLSDQEIPVGFQLEWWEGPDTVRQIWGGVVGDIPVPELVARLDSIPRSVDPLALRLVGWISDGNITGATHRLRFNLPGWADSRSDPLWLSEVQPPLPYE